jgi:hypothetical protein
MMKLAVNDENGGYFNEPQVVGPLVFPADEQATKAIKPGMLHFDDPATRGMAQGVVGWGQGLGRTGLGWDRDD